jgi:nitrite reductase/ring-hydroxylating ferredoxin subunit
MPKHVVGSVRNLPPGSRAVVEVRGRPIVVFNIEGEYFALYDRCPHLGGPLSEGILTGLVQSDEPGTYHYSRKGEILRCPWHGWEFDVRTGRSYCRPDRVRTKAYPTEVARGCSVVEGPYVAERVEVSVEDDYVVVEV